MKEKDLDHCLVARYVAGELLEEELEFFEKELLKREDYAQAVWEATLLLKGRPVERLFDVDMGLERLHASIREQHTDKKQQWGITSLLLHRWIKFAAVVVLTLLGLGLYIFLNTTTSKPPQAVAETTYYTGYERKKIVLPDGSTVQLNFNSSFTFEAASFARHRVLKLKGEAYFDVQQDQAHPFEVQTSIGSVTVLGTRFTLAAAEQASFIAEVFEGKVEVKSLIGPEQSLRLTAGQALKWEADGKIIFYTTAQSAPEWVSGILRFDQLPLKEVFQKLESYYGVQIRILALDLLDKRITGTYEQAPLELVLRQMAKVYPFDYTLNKEQLIIQPIQK